MPEVQLRSSPLILSLTLTLSELMFKQRYKLFSCTINNDKEPSIKHIEFWNAQGGKVFMSKWKLCQTYASASSFTTLSLSIHLVFNKWEAKTKLCKYFNNKRTFAGFPMITYLPICLPWGGSVFIISSTNFLFCNCFCRQGQKLGGLKLCFIAPHTCELW